MSQKTQFECPPDYKAVDIGEASVLLEDEDLEDQEMWLVRVPAQFDINSLDGKEIDINDWSNNHFTHSKDVAYTCIASKPSELNEMTVVVPSKETKSLVAVSKPLVGLCCLLREVVLPSPKMPASNKVKVEMPSGLKARFVPFGAVTPASSIRSQGKNDNLHTVTADGRQNKLHKSKKRKRRESESESPLKTAKSHKKHKSCKKKHKEEDFEL